MKMRNMSPARWSARFMSPESGSRAVCPSRRSCRTGHDVCIVEAMKVFNEIQAECSGTSCGRLVENGEPVEFGQKLFKIVSET